MAYDPEYHRQYYQANKVRKRENGRRWEKANPDKMRVMNAKKRAVYKASGQSKRWTKASEERNKERHLLRAAKIRAKKKGLIFSIDESDIVIPSHCPLLGIEIRRDVVGRMKPNSPSLDRIDNTKGYEKGNVWVISWAANRIKTDATQEMLDTFCKNWLTRTGHSVVHPPSL